MVMMMEQLSKTKMCKFEQKGLCAKGPQCPFAHDVKELQPLPDLSRSKLCITLRKTGRCDNPKCSYAHQEAELQTSGTFYKTKICKYWQSAGKCPLGQACSFAHSERELRQSASSEDHKEDSSQKSKTNFSAEPASIKLGSVETAFSKDSQPARIELPSTFHHSISVGLDDTNEAKLIRDPSPSSTTWKGWGKADIAACPEFVPTCNVPAMPAASGLPLWLPPGLTDVDDPWVLPVDKLVKSENFGEKSETIWNSLNLESYFDDLLSFSGEVDAAADESSKFSKVKKGRGLTVAEFYQAKQKCLVIEPEKVSLPCLRT